MKLEVGGMKEEAVMLPFYERGVVYEEVVGLLELLKTSSLVGVYMQWA